MGELGDDPPASSSPAAAAKEAMCQGGQKEAAGSGKKLLDYSGLDQSQKQSSMWFRR